MQKVALILAGGSGERLWPLSRNDRPKQFLSFSDNDRTLIRQTVDKVLPTFPVESIYVVTLERYFKLVREQLPDIPPENIICEPEPKNTAACIIYSAYVIRRKIGEAVMVVLPSDHYTKQDSSLLYVIEDACTVAVENDNLVTIGIVPTRPEEAYGYIRITGDRCAFNGCSAFRTERFVEKPDRETAKNFLREGNWYWNSGMFAWKTNSIISAAKRYLSATDAACEAMLDESISKDDIKRLYSSLDAVSIDCGILEKCSDLFVIPGIFEWDDVGSLPALRRINELTEDGNYLSGNIDAINSKNCVFKSTCGYVVAIGVENLIIINTGDALLVCSENSANDMKRILNSKFSDREENKG